MPFASDKLYDVYLRRNMPTIVSRVKVREIMPHLSCLTSHDRENIEAKRETSGNYDGMVLLLDCLKRRENWPEQFIQALEACEHTTLAAEIRKEYESLQSIQHPSADSAPKTVVRAHVHPAPAASKLPISESSGTGQAAAAQPAETLPPPVHTPAQQQVPQVAAVQASQTVSPPEPPQSVLQDEVPPLPSTPPPSPEIQHPQVSDVWPLLGRNAPHQEPEENSESDIRDASGDASSVPLETSLGEEEAVVGVVTSPQQPLVPHSETATLLAPDPLQTGVTTNDKQLQQPSLTPINSDESSLFTLTPEKHPVQDTTPPVHQVPTAALHPEESPEQAAEQSVKSKLQADAAVGTSPEPRVERRNRVNEDDVENTMCLSKPTQLLSVYPENTPSPSAEASNALEQPYSGNSGRLEISEAASDAASTAVGANLGNAVSVQENGIAPDLSQPEENHYESPNQSFEVRENVVHLTEMPSIPNLDAPVQQPQIVNGEPAKAGFSSTPTSAKAADDSEASLRSHHSESYTPAGAGASDSVSEQKSVPNPTPDHANRNYLIGAAAGVAALAFFLMKLKN
ncbi:mitochondrial antiviral-signaling protein [Cyprinodon tularosa]|uniref:mitochondrial antiviral-signaling protein n=1 Tax=Cyprinodon tularosa TaxID=77115 RepID=UPI0018E25FA4|nr:mitochondrial antiviral-signaling protein [Cyprinodon tularosa]